MNKIMIIIGIILMAGSVFAEEELYTLDEAIFQGEIATMGAMQELAETSPQHDESPSMSFPYFEIPATLPPMVLPAWRPVVYRPPVIATIPINMAAINAETQRIVAEVQAQEQTTKLVQPVEVVVKVLTAPESAHVTLESEHANTTAELPAMVSQEQQAALKELTTYHLKLEEQQAELEAQRQEFAHYQMIFFLAIVASVPMLGGLWWSGSHIVKEWRLMQVARHQQRLAELEASQKEFTLAEHLLTLQEGNNDERTSL